MDDAERLQRASVDRQRRHVREEDRNSVRTLSASLHDLAEIQREMGRRECVDAYRESFDIALRIEERSGAASAALNLGKAYENLVQLRDLDEAEHWYRKGLGLIPSGDRMYRAGALGQLGKVAHERFKEARAAKAPEPELRRHFNDALRWCREAVEMTPPDAIAFLAAGHDQLGTIYGYGGDLDLALHHWRESIRLKESGGDFYGAAATRYNVAAALANEGRLADARQYAEAALRGLQTYGASAANGVQETLALISRIVKAAAA